MGRWGFLMFQGDHDLDSAFEIQEKIGVQVIGGGIGRMSEVDNASTLEEARIKLDTGFGDELMKETRGKEEKLFFDPKYEACVLAAIMMHVGARIRLEDRRYLKSAYSEIPKLVGFRLPIGDAGFRKPGGAQFLAGLENYVDGQPRSFLKSYCYNCGKIDQELNGEELKRCARCVRHYADGPAASRIAYYCSKNCQAEDWENHKRICQPLGGGLNV